MIQTLIEFPEVFCPKPMDGRRWFIRVRKVLILENLQTVEIIVDKLVEENWMRLVTYEKRIRFPYIGEVFKPLVIKQKSGVILEIKEVTVQGFTFLPDWTTKIIMRIEDGTVHS